MFRVFGVIRLTSSSTIVEKLSHQLLQQCSVSGTAKGKGKMKALQTMKKSKTGAKKGGSSGGGGGYRKAGLAGDLEEITNNLPASAPVKFMKSKERAREAEREKLGLISKERQREIALIKKKAKEGTEKPSFTETPGLSFISSGLVDTDAIPKYELTAESGCKLAKDYSRVLMRNHRARQKAETTLLRLKKEAIEALPEHLKAAAMAPDLTPFSASRYMALLTPPIEEKEATEQATGKEKLR